jgi:hypothetical protein
MQIHPASTDRGIEIWVFLLIKHLKAEGLVEFQRLSKRTTWE